MVTEMVSSWMTQGRFTFLLLDVFRLNINILWNRQQCPNPNDSAEWFPHNCIKFGHCFKNKCLSKHEIILMTKYERFESDKLMFELSYITHKFGNAGHSGHRVMWPNAIYTQVDLLNDSLLSWQAGRQILVTSLIIHKEISK